jgi:hypothetical protein
MADKPNAAFDMTVDDVLGICSQGPKATVPNPHDDQETIAFFACNAAEPDDLGLFIHARNRILARQPKKAQNGDTGQTDQEEQELSILSEPKADDLNRENLPFVSRNFHGESMTPSEGVRNDEPCHSRASPCIGESRTPIGAHRQRPRTGLDTDEIPRIRQPALLAPVP